MHDLIEMLTQALHQLDHTLTPDSASQRMRRLLAEALATSRSAGGAPSSATLRVIVADDQLLIREGLVALLQRQVDIDVVAQARDGLELARLAQEHQPDLVLVDTDMPVMNGLEALRRIRTQLLPCKVICLSARVLPREVVAAIDAGAQGFVLKDNSSDELVHCVRRVMQGQIFISGELLQDTLAGMRHDRGQFTVMQLTAREREMVQLFAEGYSAQQIAGRLHVSAKTVATHREHVYAKLRIQSVAELTRFALREGLTTLDARPLR